MVRTWTAQTRQRRCRATPPLGEMGADVVGGVQVLQQQDIADPRNYRVSFDKIRRTLHFEPDYTVEAGIREVAAAVRANPDLQAYQTAIYHNVQALQQTMQTPRRRRTDWMAAAV